MTVFAAQARGIEDAVLTFLGEQEIEPEEVTLPGSPDWGRLDKLDGNNPTRAHTPKRAGAVAVATFGFSTRRSANELPWNTFT